MDDLPRNSLETHKKAAVRPLIIGLPIIACAISCVMTYLPPFLFAPTLYHKNSTGFQGKIYHLALSFGSSDDFDTTFAVYIVYECDSFGLVCHRHYCPSYEAVYYQLDAAYQHTAFISDSQTNSLFVQIGPDKTEVRKHCSYGGG